jgi:hypothetical protein
MNNLMQYKDVEIPSELSGLIGYMIDVEGYREELHNLGNQWDLLTILGQMSGTGTDMTGTRKGFQRLTSELLGQLGLETLKKVVQEIDSKAQVAVDIVIRNLFERTADIGFLATDDDIREFLVEVSGLVRQMAGPGVTADQLAELEELRAGHVERIVARFQEYVAKYSVYFNIILMDTEGQVLAQLDPDNDVRESGDPLINEALVTTGEYVEIFRRSDLIRSGEESLIYAYRVTETNDPESEPLGVLCLCFRFKNEMEGVFRNLGKEGEWSVMTLLDKTGRVIASSDEHHIPMGAMLDFDLDAKFKVMQFAGREYLAATCATKGYQGFFGLGWFGHVMIPLEHAFARTLDMNQSVKQSVLEAVMNDPRLFSRELRSIPLQAEHIQRELERTVWNGNVRESDGQSKVLLWNISDAGARTKMVFEQSIGNLHETVVSGILNDVEFQASLAVDIMDRNLYERANDCRWWALTSAFRKILSQQEISTLDAEISCWDRILRNARFCPNRKSPPWTRRPSPPYWSTSTGCTPCTPTCSFMTPRARSWPCPTSPSPGSWVRSFPTICPTTRCTWTTPRRTPCPRSRPRPCMTGGIPTSTGRPSPTSPGPTGAWAASASSSTASPSSGKCSAIPCPATSRARSWKGVSGCSPTARAGSSVPPWTVSWWERPCNWTPSSFA